MIQLLRGEDHCDNSGNTHNTLLLIDGGRSGRCGCGQRLLPRLPQAPRGATLLLSLLPWWPPDGRRRTVQQRHPCRPRHSRQSSAQWTRRMTPLSMISLVVCFATMPSVNKKNRPTVTVNFMVTAAVLASPSPARPRRPAVLSDSWPHPVPSSSPLPTPQSAPEIRSRSGSASAGRP